ncbi:MAG: M1 family metallopeptidase [Ignavibacteria bacterium]
MFIKMFQRAFITAIIVLIAANSFSQDYYFVPKEIRAAIKNNTRTNSGLPGSKYWQNKSQYRIEALVDFYSYVLYGKEQISYYNNSPDDLYDIVIRTYQDFAIAGKSRDWEITEKDFTEGMVIKHLRINNQPYDLADKNVVRRAGTNIYLKLYSPIKSNSSAVLEIEWEFTIPGENFPRMGRYDSTAMMIAYWYPQISVYDDIDGWDKTDYKGQVEFYNDFNDYDVSIKTNKSGVIVWATGTLKNPEEVFTQKFLSYYNSSQKNLITISDLPKIKEFTTSAETGEWKYTAFGVPDFVFSLSDHYLWDRNVIQLQSGKTVTVNVAYKSSSYWYKYVIDIASQIIQYLSNEMPGIEFPFSAMTVFNGEGGMEYPMMVNDGTTDTWESTVFLTAHEISHTYFPFYMGINERKYAWMDEGWAVFLPMEFQTRVGRQNPEGLSNFQYDVKQRNVKNYLTYAGSFYDFPLLAVSSVLRAPTYRHNSYSKAALVYDLLEQILGEKEFKFALQSYINIWNGKHPTPFDFFNIIENISGKNLKWFWKRCFMEYNVADLEIKDATIRDGILTLRIFNRGGLPLPLCISVSMDSGNSIIVTDSPEIWKDTNIKEYSIELHNKKPVTITLGNLYIPDIDTTNNIFQFE